MSAPAVEALNVSKRYGRIEALTGVSFFVPGKAVTVLLGENGAGKTTALKLVLGFLRPDGGLIESRTSRVGYVPDRPAFFPWLRGRDVLAATALASGVDRPGLDFRVAGLSDRLGFDPGLLGRPVQAYSPGNRKKFAYLQSLLPSPDLLVADEPFSSLDPEAIRSLRALFLDLKREGTTLLLSSHAISEMERLCDSFIIIKRGRVVVQEGLDTLRQSHVLVRLPRGFAAPDLVDRRDPAGSYAWTRTSGGEISVLAARDKAARLTAAAGGPGLVQIEPPTLESLYFFFTS